ncbi:MAG: family 1 glycosylhydrolase, partial [Actinomycetota bacterium]
MTVSPGSPSPSPRVFPEGFLWGAAGCAHQTEGNNTNSDWWEHELAPGTNAAEPSGNACDSYNRYEEDWRLAARSGQNSTRFSVEWARIEPEPGVFSSKEIDHYRDVIGSARDLGLKTCVTLHHFTVPTWFARGGGWGSGEAVQAFGRYAGKVCESMGDLLEIVNTINEPSVVAILGHLAGYMPPRASDLELTARVTANLIKAHGAAMRELRAKTEAKAGVVLQIPDMVPANDTPEARQYWQLARHAMAGVYIGALKDGWIRGLGTLPDEKVADLGGTDDFVGVQYYTKFVTDPEKLSATLSMGDKMDAMGGEPGERVTQMGWVWHPVGLGNVLDWAAESGLPVMVTENGIATDDDAERIEYV